ncbi:peptidase inhibitor family I36 protein [Nocardiopsis endophytica]|uniref:peptidase inhibitor family I36 protein n=1 Tax=Nocardiopsis endophytica TaxID=3018445 RepID=UPI0022E612F5|nr:peptidase inhibitor family I36 protein [Nocardiopsis endophytica]
MSRKSIALGAAGLVLASGTAAAAGAPASAEAQAAPGEVRMWEDPDYTGSLYVQTRPSQCPAEGCDIDGWDGDNEISSVINETGCTVRLWDLDGFGGGYVDLRPGRYGNLELQGFDNKAESYTFYC